MQVAREQRLPRRSGTAGRAAAAAHAPPSSLAARRRPHLLRRRALRCRPASRHIAAAPRAALRAPSPFGSGLAPGASARRCPSISRRGGTRGVGEVLRHLVTPSAVPGRRSARPRRAPRANVGRRSVVQRGGGSAWAIHPAAALRRQVSAGRPHAPNEAWRRWLLRFIVTAGASFDAPALSLSHRRGGAAGGCTPSASPWRPTGWSCWRR